ncbi:MAG TPA: hypothetical protein VHV09_01585 [Trebonia sp.]|jgi:hypothetical protein|nr:hypothetical protein [Trebonia sp.]
MPAYLPHSGDYQAIAVLGIGFLGILCARYWRVTLAIATALLIAAGLITLNVILDLRVLHQVIGYLHDVRDLFG